MRVRDIMSWRVQTLDERADLELAEGLMAVLHIRHLPVVRDGRLVGLVTHRDLLAASLSPLAEPSADQHDHFKTTVPVRDIMRRNVETTTVDTDLRAALGQMRSHRHGCLPVVDGEDRLVGIVTEADFLALAQRVLDRASELLPEAWATLAEVDEARLWTKPPD